MTETETKTNTTHNMLNQYKIIGFYSNGEEGREIVDKLMTCCPDQKFKIISCQDFIHRTATQLFNFDSGLGKLKEINSEWKQSNETLVEITDEMLRKMPKMFSKLDWTCGNFTEKLNFSSKYLYQRLTERTSLDASSNSDLNSDSIYIVPDVKYMDEAFIIEKLNGLLIQIISNSPSVSQEEEKQSYPQPQPEKKGKKVGRKRKAVHSLKGKKAKKNQTKNRKISLNEKLNLNSNYYHFSLSLGQPENVNKLLSTFFNSNDLGDLFGYTFTVTDTFIAPHPEMRPNSYKKEITTESNLNNNHVEVQIPVTV